MATGNTDGANNSQTNPSMAQGNTDGVGAPSDKINITCFTRPTQTINGLY
jgi:hypothetical protein